MNHESLKHSEREPLPGFGAMALRGKSYQEARRLAQLFSNASGHIANVPEALQARINVDSRSPLWRYPLNTQSWEFFGHSSSGIPLIVVCHENGPLNELNEIQAAYQAQDHNGMPSGGRISQSVFQELLGGKYGPVDILEYESLADSQHTFGSGVPPSYASENSLFRARLGQDFLKVLEWLDKTTRQRAARFNLPADREWPVLTNNYSSQYRSFNAGDTPLAHMLSLSGSISLGSSQASFGFSLGLLPGLKNITTLIGIKHGRDTAKTCPPVSFYDGELETVWPSLFKPNTEHIKPPKFVKLQRIGNHWFTERAKSGSGMDTAEIQFKVRNATRIDGGPLSFSTSHYDSPFFKYSVSEVQNIAPKGANAYYFPVEDDLVIKNEADIISNPIEFYQVEIDESAYVPEYDSLESDFDALIKSAALLYE